MDLDDDDDRRVPNHNNNSNNNEPFDAEPDFDAPPPGILLLFLFNLSCFFNV